MTVTKQFKITKVMSAKSRRSNLSQNSTLKMVPWQFYLAPWLLQTRLMAIFVAVVGLTIAGIPASALAFKTDNFINNSSVNSLDENHSSLNLELDGTKTKLTANEAIDQFKLNRVQPYDFNTQTILADKYTTDNQVSQLLQKAGTNIQEIIQASEVSSQTIDGKTFFIYRGDTNITPNTHTYTNTWKAPTSPPKRTIPEPSTMLGLIAIASLFVTQRQKMKIG